MSMKTTTNEKRITDQRNSLQTTKKCAFRICIRSSYSKRSDELMYEIDAVLMA